MAGQEALGTGIMKFCMNGALTIGTPDGANIEVGNAVGAANFFMFGPTAQQVAELQRQGYAPPRLLRIEQRTARGHRPHPRRLLRPR